MEGEAGGGKDERIRGHLYGCEYVCVGTYQGPHGPMTASRAGRQTQRDINLTQKAGTQLKHA